MWHARLKPNSEGSIWIVMMHVVRVKKVGKGSKDDRRTDDCTRLGSDWEIKVWEGYQV